jgi:YidC/Oxa1 family membrane protein insertase
MKKNAKMQEKMKEIQNKYKNDPERLNQATIDLYKNEKINPFSGCLSSILQLLIILSVFWLVSKPLTYMKKVDTEVINNYINEIKEEDGSTANYPEIQVIQRKAAEDETVYINMNFLGLDLSKVPLKNLNDPTVYIIPILYVITSFVSIKMTNSSTESKKKKKNDNVTNENNSEDDTLESMQQMTNSMNYMVPIMSISIAFIAPLGLALYWFVSNILIIIERLIINKFFNNNKEEEVNA